MKIFILLAVMSFSSFSYGMTYNRMIKVCKSVGVTKVLEQAQDLGVSISKEDIYACGADYKILNIFAENYAWFCAPIPGSDEIIRVMTKKVIFKACR